MKFVMKPKWNRILVLPLLAVAMQALADDKTDVKKEVEYQMNTYASALKAKNPGAVETLFKRVCTSDFVATGPDGSKQKLNEFISIQKALVRAPVKIEKLTLGIVSIKVEGLKATVKSKSELVGVFEDKASKKKYRVQFNDMSEDTLVKIGTSWKLKASRGLGQTRKLLGEVK